MSQEKNLKNGLIINLVLLAVVGSGCAHTSDNAKEAAKTDTPLASPVTTGAPALEVPEWYHNFGSVKEDSDYLHTFVIRNKGNGVLEIRKIQPG